MSYIKFFRDFFLDNFLRLMLKLDGLNPDWYVLYADFLAQRKHIDLAESLLAEALDIDGLEPSFWFWNNLASYCSGLYHKTGNDDYLVMASRALNSAAALDAHNPVLIANSESYWRLLNKHQEICRQIYYLEENPAKTAEENLQLAIALVKIHKFSLADEYFLRAINLSNGLPAKTKSFLAYIHFLPLLGDLVGGSDYQERLISEFAASLSEIDQASDLLGAVEASLMADWPERFTEDRLTGFRRRLIEHYESLNLSEIDKLWLSADFLPAMPIPSFWQEPVKFFPGQINRLKQIFGSAFYRLIYRNEKIWSGKAEKTKKYFRLLATFFLLLGSLLLTVLMFFIFVCFFIHLNNTTPFFWR